MLMFLALLVAPAALAWTILRARSAHRLRSWKPLAAPLVALALDGMVGWAGAMGTYYWLGYDVAPRPYQEEVVGSWGRAGLRVTFRADRTCEAEWANPCRWTFNDDGRVSFAGRNWLAMRSRDGVVLCEACPEGVDPDAWSKVLWKKKAGP